jgi:sirohydrochlorin cobaltochelatase
VKKGILLVAHGSRVPKWRQGIQELIENLHINYPIEIGFLDGLGEEGIIGALLGLKRFGVKRALVIPLFVCSGSGHIEEIRAVLGFNEGKITALLHGISLNWGEPLNDHPLIRKVIKERIQNLSTNPEKEVLMLVAHGSQVQEKQQVWEAMIARMASSFKKDFGFKGVTYATIRPNTLKRRAQAVSRTHSLLILPLFICEGYYTNQFIPQELAGITYRYDQSPYLPLPNGVRWVEEMIENWV